MGIQQPQTLFGHLAARFSVHPENLATESLSYIIDRSATARSAFIWYLAQVWKSLPEALTFRTQARAEDNAIPDMVGMDSDGQQRVLIEAKFWAGLTDGQPLRYLDRLSQQGGTLLLFIAPSKRFTTLWSELLRRCAAGGVGVSRERNVTAELLSASTEDGRVLALGSWRSVVSCLLKAVETERDASSASDLAQLAGLCDRMDDDAFLPLSSEELSSNRGQRIIQLCSVVDEVADLAIKQRIASEKGLRPSAAAGWYGRYLNVQGYGCRLALDAHHWAQSRETPVWFRVWGKMADKWRLSPSVRARLSRLESEHPPRLIVGERELVIPIFLPTLAERSEVVSSAFDQVQEIAALLAE